MWCRATSRVRISPFPPEKKPPQGGFFVAGPWLGPRSFMAISRKRVRIAPHAVVWWRFAFRRTHDPEIHHRRCGPCLSCPSCWLCRTQRRSFDRAQPDATAAPGYCLRCTRRPVRHWQDTRRQCGRGGAPAIRVVHSSGSAAWPDGHQGVQRAAPEPGRGCGRCYQESPLRLKLPNPAEPSSLRLFVLAALPGWLAWWLQGRRL